jgi:hypothetical protein
VFAPTRLRVGVVDEETNKFVSLSLNFSRSARAGDATTAASLTPLTLETIP